MWSSYECILIDVFNHDARNNNEHICTSVTLKHDILYVDRKSYEQ